MRFVVPFALLLLATPAVAAPADAIVGTWKIDDGGSIAISKCGDRYCGKIASLPSKAPQTDANNPDEKLRARKIEGLKVLTRAKYDADEKAWVDGRMYAPKEGKTVDVELKLKSPKELEVKASVGIFSKTFVWTR